MKRLFFCLSCALLAATVAYAAAPVTGDPASGWEIRTPSSLYRVIVDKDGNVKSAALGPASLEAQPPWGLMAEVPVSGGRRMMTRPQFEVVFPDQVRDVELTFDGGEIRDIDGRSTLVIRQKDKYYPLTVTSYLRVIPELDLIEKWIELNNTGKKPIRIANMLSGSFFLPRDQYEVTTLGGDWGNEFVPETTLLTGGTKTIEVRDFKSYGSSGFVVRRETDDPNGAVPSWFGMVLYSGNWKVDFFKRFSDFVQIQGGINWWDSSWQLEGGQTLAAPKMVFGYTEGGQQAASQLMSDYVRTQCLRQPHRGQLRPVVYNSWFATEFNIREDQQYELAKVAKELGVETFVMDDGWFKGRVDDHAGLGDWTVDKNKFPSGLKSLIDKINGLGLDFGLWVEPEMVNPNSDLYRAHPDWIIHFPNRERSLYRYQSVLNLAREDVYQYLLTSLSDLLANHNITYIKWDHNRGLSQPGWPGETPERQMEMRMRYVDNLYRLLDELTTRFPDVWFENCSSGGGRVDGEIFRRMDLNWTSDYNDVLARQFIQYGYLGNFPANTMLGLVAAEDRQEAGVSLGYKFDVMMQGVLGVGDDLLTWTPEQKALGAEKIALYKQIRPTVQEGKVYRLLSPFEGDRNAIQYVARDGSEAVLMCYNRDFNIRETSPEFSRAYLVRLQGLAPGAVYTVEGYEGTYTGANLMQVGLGWFSNKAFASRIIRITRQ